MEEAVSRGDAVLVGKLVKKGADINTTNKVQLCLFILRCTAFRGKRKLAVRSNFRGEYSILSCVRGYHVYKAYGR